MQTKAQVEKQNRDDCIAIKALIEKVSNINDIGERTRKRPIPEMKKFYASLCKEFTQASLECIGECLGSYDHATILHLAKSFRDLDFAPNGFEYEYIYIKAREILLTERSIVLDKIKPKNIQAIEQKHRITLIKIINKGHSIINRQREEINSLKNQLNRINDMEVIVSK